MSNNNDKLHILLALAASKTDQANVSDEELAKFVAGELDDAAHARVFESLATDPIRLHDARQAHKAEQAHAAALQPNEITAKSGSATIEHWQKFKAWWISLGGAGGFALAVVAYLMLSPSLQSLNHDILASYAMVNASAPEFTQSTMQTKTFAFGMSKEKQDFNWGVKATQLALNIRDKQSELRQCENQQDCAKQSIIVVLGRWYELNRLQCKITNSINEKYWLKQVGLYNRISLELKSLNITGLVLEPIMFGGSENNQSSTLKTQVCQSLSLVNSLEL